jgi:hypothetical protein
MKSPFSALFRALVPALSQPLTLGQSRFIPVSCKRLQNGPPDPS